MKLRSKLPLLFVGVSIVSVAVVCLITYFIARSSLRARVLENLESTASLQKKRIVDIMTQNRERVRLVASRTQLRLSLREFLRTEAEEHRERMTRILRDARESVGAFRRISVLNLEGRVVASTDPHHVGAAHADSDYFREARNQISVKSLYLDEDGRLCSHLAAPLRLEEETLGVALVDCGMEDLLELLLDYTGRQSTGETFLVAAQEGGKARVLSPLRRDQDAALRRTIPARREKTPAIQALSRNAHRLAEATDYRGRPVLAATQYLPGPGWGLVVKIDRAEALEPVSELRNLFLLVLALSAAVVGLLSLRLGRSIAAPIVALTRVAGRIREGEFSDRAEVQTADEIGELASAFNGMAGRLEEELQRAKEHERSLRSYKTELEEKVEERTKQLSEANEALREEVEEHKRARQEVERLSHRNDLMLKSAGEGICGIDEDGNIVFINPAGAKMLGYRSEDLQGKPFHQTVHYHRKEGGKYPAEDCPILSTLRSEEIHHGDDTMWRADGSCFPVAFTSTPVRREGETVRMVVVLEDVTERKEREQKLRTTMRELERSNEELERFAYVASHDLQEPLRKVRVFAERVQHISGDDLEERTTDYLHRMGNAAARMQELINDLLTFSRVATRGQPFQEADMSRVAHNVVTDLQLRIEEMDAEVEVVDPLPTIEADPTQMRQILQNLIANALKFHREGVPPRIRISGEVGEAEDGTQVARIRVADNGIGMDEKYLDRIFTIFQRLHPRDEYGGTGLGLALCKKIVERHNGYITAHSTPGQGSTFIVTLPLEQEEE